MKATKTIVHIVKVYCSKEKHHTQPHDKMKTRSIMFDVNCSLTFVLNDQSIMDCM
jgi:hypothetical protein